MTNTGPTRFRRPGRVLLAIALSIAVLASACGDDESAGDVVDDVSNAGGDLGDEAVELGEDAEVPSEDDAEDAQDSLADALETAGLESVASAVGDIDVSELTDAAEFTFFAPNDDAFQSLSADELADILTNPTEITDILRNHVIPSRLDAATLTGETSVTTEAGNELDVVVDGDTVTVGGATVVETDLEAGDGVVHVIDALLLPE